jgi:hypothetical protein
MKRGQKHGNGTETNSNGEIYKGEWINNKREGNGVLQYLIGMKYEGEWINN